MERVSNKLDFLTKHWAPFPRRYPGALPLVTTDRIREKDNWIRRSFHTCNFSIILRGRGEFTARGKTWEVRAPCVLTQWPDELLVYGPTGPEGTWDELYLIYPRALLPALLGSKMIDPERPTWAIAHPAAVEEQVAEFTALMRHPRPETVVDRVDRVAERLVLETLLDPVVASEDAVIAAIVEDVARNLGQSVDFGEIAARHGMSATTFRRRWIASMNGVPPARYLQGLRMREACRRLVETADPIHEVAAAVGFADEFYFSRRFHHEQGMPPRVYRQTYRLRAGRGGAR